LDELQDIELGGISQRVSELLLAERIGDQHNPLLAD
jgi:hypothetical protein